MHFLGIPKENLIAVDVREQPSFWPITIDADYKANEDDILLIAWGYSHTPKKTLQDFIKYGGKKVVILGEQMHGCTFPADYFTGSSVFDIIELKKVVPDYLSFNERKPNTELQTWKFDMLLEYQGLNDRKPSINDFKKHDYLKKYDHRESLFTHDEYNDFIDIQLSELHADEAVLKFRAKVVYGPTRFDGL